MATPLDAVSAATDELATLRAVILELQDQLERAQRTELSLQRDCQEQVRRVSALRTQLAGLEDANRELPKPAGCPECQHCLRLSCKHVEFYRATSDSCGIDSKICMRCGITEYC